MVIGSLVGDAEPARRQNPVRGGETPAPRRESRPAIAGDGAEQCFNRTSKCHRLDSVPNSLVAGKNAGNFADSAAFCEHPSWKHLRIRVFADEFPTQTSREYFCQRRELFARAGNEQGISRKTDPRVAMHPMA